jgi:uncharacterized protein (DUF2235 family)
MRRAKDALAPFKMFSVEVVVPDKKNIVICCDGTGNVYGNYNSNVVRLYSTLEINAQQVGYYHPGVGTMGAPSARNKLEEKWSILKGLAFGAGLMANVGDAYRFLMETYRDNDDIYLFGFSRGAYTVRALAGVLHMYGLLCPGNDGLIPYITKSYARVSRELAAHRNTFDVAAGFKKTFSRNVTLHFVGVWDTVSSVGWIYDPVKLPYTGRNPIMRIGRQAVSIDERRIAFRDNLWGTPFRPQEGEYHFALPQDIKQVWFAGVHSDIGGSYPEEESGLSKLALEWMLREASLAGLLVDDRKVAAVLGRFQDIAEKEYAQPDAAAKIHESLKGAWWILQFFPHKYWDNETRRVRWTIPLLSRRDIPVSKETLMHRSVQQRLAEIPDYQPKNVPGRSLQEYFTIEPQIEFPGPQQAVSSGRG